MRATSALLAALLLAAAAPASRASEFVPNRLFVASLADDRVMIYDGAGNVRGAIGAHTSLVDPRGIAFGPDGRLYVISAGTGNVKAFGPDPGGALASFGSGLVDPRGIAFDPQGRLYVGEGGSDSVRVYDPDSGALLDTVGAGTGLIDPGALAFGADGHLFVACRGTSRIHEFDPSGVLVRQLGAGSGIASASGLALGSDGRFYVASANSDSIVVLDAAGQQVDELGEDSELAMPQGLAFGPDGRLAVVSGETDQVLLFDVATDTVQEVVSKSLHAPVAVAWSPFRFAFTTRGKLRQAGQETKVVQKGVLSVAPGSGLLMLALEADEAGGDLADAFGDGVFVLPGFERSDSPSDKRRAVQGTWIPLRLPQRGSASLGLLLSGKLDGDGLFQVKKAKGSFLRQGAAGVYGGKASTHGKLK